MVTNDYRIVAFPTTIIIAPDGTIAEMPASVDGDHEAVLNEMLDRTLC